MSDRGCTICNIFAAIIAVVIGGPIVWWAVDREPAYISVDGIAVPGIVAPDESVDIVWGTVNVLRTGCVVKYQREIVDSIGHVWSFTEIKSTFANWTFGIHKNSHSANLWQIPHGITEGEATLHSHVISSCNPVQNLFPVRTVTGTVKITIKRPK